MIVEQHPSGSWLFPVMLSLAAAITAPAYAQGDAGECHSKDKTARMMTNDGGRWYTTDSAGNKTIETRVVPRSYVYTHYDYYTPGAFSDEGDWCATHYYGHGNTVSEWQAVEGAPAGREVTVARTVAEPRVYGGPLSVEGTITKLESIDLFGDQHLFAMVRKSDGKTCVADLGPRSELARLDLREGNTIRIEGRRGLLVAGRVSSNDEMVVIDGRWIDAGPGAVASYQAAGVIQKVERLATDGGPDLIVYLAKPKDNIAPPGEWGDRINLGRERHLKDQGLAIREGEFIRARGHRGHVLGSAMLFAEQFNLGGAPDTASPVAMSAVEGSFTGEITSTWTERRGGEMHTLAAVRLADGSTVNVDLGRSADVENVRLARGDDICVRGQRESDGNGSECVVASSVQVNNGSWKTLRR